MPAETLPHSPGRTIEQRRALLRKALVLRADDPRVMPALRALLTREYVQEAAEKGVFIAYHRAEEVFALELTVDLRDRGINVWMDEMDVVGDDWNKEVQTALKLCGVMLYLVSSQSAEDPEIKRYYNYFMNAGKVVVPILNQLYDVTPLALDHPIVDFRRDYAYGLEQLLQLLRSSEETLLFQQR